jgi:choline dehydrogenase-like flavoprotein
MGSTNTFDAIVIGSGISGGFAAKELTEKGLRVLMLDRGFMVEHGEGYPYDGKPAFELPARGEVPKAIVDSDYFIAKHGYPPRGLRRQVADLGPVVLPLEPGGLRGEQARRDRRRLADPL